MNNNYTLPVTEEEMQTPLLRMAVQVSSASISAGNPGIPHAFLVEQARCYMTGLVMGFRMALEVADRHPKQAENIIKECPRTIEAFVTENVDTFVEELNRFRAEWKEGT